MNNNISAHVKNIKSRQSNDDKKIRIEIFLFAKLFHLFFTKMYDLFLQKNNYDYACFLQNYCFIYFLQQKMIYFFTKNQFFYKIV